MTNASYDDTVITRIKKGSDEAIVQLYREQRPAFIQWVSKQYGLSNDEGIELFQLSVVILYDQIMTGKLTSLSSSLSTYLFAIGKNKAREYLRKNKKEVALQDGLMEYVRSEDEIGMMKDKEDRLTLMERAMLHLGDKCRDLLRLFYYKKMSMDDIAQLLNYNSRGTAKNMKYKCLQQLRNKMESL